MSPRVPMPRSVNFFVAGSYEYSAGGTTQLDSEIVAPGVRGSANNSPIWPSNGSGTPPLAVLRSENGNRVGFQIPGVGSRVLVLFRRRVGRPELFQPFEIERLRIVRPGGGAKLRAVDGACNLVAARRIIDGKRRVLRAAFGNSGRDLAACSGGRVGVGAQ